MSKSLNVLNVPSLQKIARLGVAYISSKMLEDFEKEVKEAPAELLELYQLSQENRLLSERWDLTYNG